LRYGEKDTMQRRGVAPALVTVLLPPALVALFPGSQAEVEVTASNVDDMIDALNDRWHGMRDRLCDSTPSIRRHINIFVDGERAALQTPLAPGTQVYVLTAMSGG